MVKPLPLKIDVETKQVLKKALLAHQSLAELKGLITSIPSQNILIETATLKKYREFITTGKRGACNKKESRQK